MDTVINGLYGSKNRIISLQMGFKWLAYSNQAVHLHCSFWVYVTYVKTLLNYGNFTLLPWYWRWRRLRHHCCFVITRILPHIALHYMHIEIRTRKRKSFFLNEKRSLLKAYNKLIKKNEPTWCSSETFLRLPCVMYSNNEKQSWLLMMEAENEYAWGKRLWLKTPSASGLIMPGHVMPLEWAHGEGKGRRIGSEPGRGPFESFHRLVWNFLSMAKVRTSAASEMCAHCLSMTQPVLMHRWLGISLWSGWGIAQIAQITNWVRSCLWTTVQPMMGKTQPTLSNIWVEFLPKNITSIL